jgi:hypothetical protein
MTYSPSPRCPIRISGVPIFGWRTLSRSGVTRFSNQDGRLTFFVIDYLSVGADDNPPVVVKLIECAMDDDNRAVRDLHLGITRTPVVEVMSFAVFYGEYV